MTIFLKFLFLMTPFFSISMFLTMAGESTIKEQRKLSLQVGLSTWLISLVLLLSGQYILNAFGVTVDSFRIGGGLLLTLSGIGLVNSKPSDKLSSDHKAHALEITDIAVVPLATPIIIGPATIAALVIDGIELSTVSQYVRHISSITAAVATITLLLYCAGWMQRTIGRHGLQILSKLTGLILVAMGSQLIVSGVKSILNSQG